MSSVDKITNDDEKPVQLCNYVDVYKHDAITGDLNFMHATATADEVKRFTLRRGDVLITKDSESWDDIAIPALVADDLPGVLCGYHLAQLRPMPNRLHGAYLLRILQAEPIVQQFHVAATGVTRFGLSYSDIKNAVIPLPPLPEQQAISRFLDRQDRRIGRFIRAKRRLIELLTEQKQAIIHRAVTRGLDPDMALTPSGVDWLGDVPAHWEVRRLKEVAQIRLSGVDKHTIQGEQRVALCNYTDVYKNDFITNQMDFMQASATEAEIEALTLRTGDVLITKDSETPDDIGVPAVVQEDVPGLICGYHLALVRPNLRIIDGNFLFRSLSDLRLAEQFYVAATGVTRFGLSKHDVKNVLIPVPELVEQRAIAAYLASTSFEVEIIIARTRREIELIREYRTRLIADVVTGKIDVRGHPDAAEDAVFDETMELDADDAFGMRDGDEGLEGEVLPEENQE